MLGALATVLVCWGTASQAVRVDSEQNAVSTLSSKSQVTAPVDMTLAGQQRAALESVLPTCVENKKVTFNQFQSHVAEAHRTLGSGPTDSTQRSQMWAIYKQTCNWVGAANLVELSPCPPTGCLKLLAAPVVNKESGWFDYYLISPERGLYLSYSGHYDFIKSGEGDKHLGLMELPDLWLEDNSAPHRWQLQGAASKPKFCLLWQGSVTDPPFCLEAVAVTQPASYKLTFPSLKPGELGLLSTLCIVAPSGANWATSAEHDSWKCSRFLPQPAGGNDYLLAEAASGFYLVSSQKPGEKPLVVDYAVGGIMTLQYHALGISISGYDVLYKWRATEDRTMFCLLDLDGNVAVEFKGQMNTFCLTILP